MDYYSNMNIEFYVPDKKISNFPPYIIEKILMKY